MKYVTYEADGMKRVGLLDGDQVLDAGFGGDMVAFIEAGAPLGAGRPHPRNETHELALSTVTARRFCDQQEMSLQTATGRSLP